jgi:hypothetical protein
VNRSVRSNLIQIVLQRIFGMRGISAKWGATTKPLPEAKQALELEPLDITIGANFSRYYLFARQYDKTLEQSKKSFDLEPGNPADAILLVKPTLARECTLRKLMRPHELRVRVDAAQRGSPNT